MSDHGTRTVSLRNRPSFLLSQIGFRSDELFDDLLDPLGVTRRQFGVLRLLTNADGQTQQHLAGQLRIHRNVMVGMVDELESRDLVQRRRHPADRRAHAVHLTDTARRMVSRGEGLLDACDDALLDPLNSAERATLLTLLQRVAGGAAHLPDVHPGMARTDP